jgi:hypothetical protein
VRVFSRHPRHVYCSAAPADEEFRQRGGIQPSTGVAALIIDAARRFGCAHRFIVTPDEGLMVFVCECCGHRAEILPLHRDGARGQVMAFTRLAAAARPSRRRRIVPARRASGLKR